MKFQELEFEELKSIDGGIACGGWCIAGVVLFVGSALGVGIYNGYNNAADKAAGKK
ncbi:class IIb bacteriocin, lactobin A/cerein 7B family [Flammeovirga agarivorans]|uniref:Class IIb bacteriocin, lactobin A/cerein 7B family n=1 Tax=Flammeovirga agarivorans TaxID=2726742 RepID=A0A7X8XXA0_9BACT|nr:Blp family class II bacteriocin [Flammeovirga agarivorans]NLR92885.1 class IIb bacteriocin, lactobin A/cerein 7B family [Flammeovirga agarivorans]